MSSTMGRRNKILMVMAAGALLVVAGAVTLESTLQSKIAKRLEKGWVLPPLELYSQGFALSVGRLFARAAVEAELQHQNLRSERDFLLADAEACTRLTGVALKTTSQHCLWLKKTEREPPRLITWDENAFIQEIWSGEPWAPQPSLSLFPRLITQFYDGQPILQQNTPLSEMPLACLQAATAIEDREFLEHGGVSATGILRAILRNVRARRWAEGGSTITQQLVKNFFLTSKKTLRRKIEEQLLAIMLEAQLTKDQILEMYLNVIYMGQSGPYQVRGFGSASLNYFDKPIAELNLPECAMLAALINNPGRYSPITHPQPAQTRRELVLQKMLDAKMLNASEFAAAKVAPLPAPIDPEKHTHAPYFVMSALREYAALGVEAEEGARLFTTLDPELQSQAMLAVSSQLAKVEARIKHPSKQPLQVAAVTVDLNSAQILTLTGGRDYRTTQFNRASESRRQIGSTVKPFVYYPAMATHDALTAVSDDPFEWKTGHQVWKPKDFEKESVGSVPYFYALAHSLNIAAARVGQEVGLARIAQTLRAAGVTSEFKELPALTLGTLELSPLEVAQIYSTMARFGNSDRLHSILRVEDLAGGVLYAHEASTVFHLDPLPAAQVVGMLEQSLTLGTARSARAAGLAGAFAGKTGTTSDTKDAWFAGFQPRLLHVVWVGYDDNTVMGLTGAGAALPLWTEFMKAAAKFYTPEDFAWPEGSRPQTFKSAELLEKFPNLRDLPEETTLIFAK